MKRYLNDQTIETKYTEINIFGYSFQLQHSSYNLQNIFSYRNILHSKLVQRLLYEKQILPSILGMV